jgi:hypothetical protein
MRERMSSNELDAGMPIQIISWQRNFGCESYVAFCTNKFRKIGLNLNIVFKLQ